MRPKIHQESTQIIPPSVDSTLGGIVVPQRPQQDSLPDLMESTQLVPPSVDSTRPEVPQSSDSLATIRWNLNSYESSSFRPVLKSVNSTFSPKVNSSKIATKSRELSYNVLILYRPKPSDQVFTKMAKLTRHFFWFKMSIGVSHTGIG